MRCKIIVLSLCFLCPLSVLRAQEKYTGGEVIIGGIVQDIQTKEVLSYATIRLISAHNLSYGTISDNNGRFRIPNLHPGYYTLSVSYLGYDKLEQHVLLTKSQTLDLHLSSSVTALNEVVVTAHESQSSITSTSTIDATAMKHLQPSSFTDLLELLPGGKSTDPDMSGANLINLRNARSSATEITSSLGVSFVVDDHPLNTDGNLQDMGGYGSTSETGKMYASKGVDMRTISTDPIESVHITRGIPSVEYGSLTSGLVEIKLKSKKTPVEVRFKADQKSKLFAIGKGIGSGNGTDVLHLDLSYLDAKTDPRNTIENYRRVTTSMRWNANRALSEQHIVRMKANIGYTGSIDNSKYDPELMTQEDRYKSSYTMLNAGGLIEVLFPAKSVVRSLKLTGNISQSFDKIEKTKFVSVDRPTPVPNTTETGESDADFLPTQYVGSMEIDGKPLSAYTKLSAHSDFSLLGIKNTIKAGAEFTYTKNYGRGMVYDVNRPVNASASFRPRRYKDIPGKKELALYLEETMTIPFDTHELEIVMGIRAGSLPGLNAAYAMSGKVLVDPRFQAQWKLPEIGGWQLDLSAGLGWHSKTPTIEMLYPAPYYTDIVELNYYHANPDYRRIHLMTYKWDTTNYNLEAARNRKVEVRLGVSYKGNTFSVTCFDERMKNGFRKISYYTLLPYKVYDSGSVDHANITAPPALEDMTSRQDTLVNARSNKWGNGSDIHKQGIEFQFASKRIDLLKTRITINGAWFKTTTSNNSLFYKESSILINNEQLKYIGLYDYEDGAEYQLFNTNFKFDTYLKRLGLTFSTDFQCTWYTTSRPLWNNGTPLYYISKDGTQHVFKEEDKSNIYLQHLVNNYPDGYFSETRVPFAMDINFKATKEIGKHITLALYVNRILTAYPKYHAKNVLVRRYASPYFGMEMHIKI